MDHHLSPGASAAGSSVDSGDFVRIPVAVYKQVIKERSQQHLQRVAANNLQRLIHEKDEELIASKEKVQQLQLALGHSETRLSHVIGLQATATVAATSLEADGASVNVNVLSQYNDVETDGPEPVQTPVTSIWPSDVPSHSVKSRTLNSIAQNPETAVLSPQVTLPSADTSATLSDNRSIFVTSLPSSVTGQVLSMSSSMNPESNDLLDKVLQQNARLKKMLRDFLSQKGLSVSTYLDKQEYEDAAEILRHDLMDAQRRVSQLKSIIASRNDGDIDRISQECARLTDKVALLERKLAISQAYGDAVKQAHDRCKQDGSNNATMSSEEPSSVSSSDYTQVLEELEKVKIQCKDCEKTCHTLQAEKEALLQQLQLTEKLTCELDALKREHEQLIEERQLNQSQIAAFEEDFKMEQKEKQEQQKTYEMNIAKHQEWIRRLAAETQKCRASWQEERTRREEFEKRLKISESGQMSSQMCHSPRSPLGVPPLPQVVKADCGPDPSIEYETERRRTENFVCPRCEREFPCTEEAKWQVHCRRCTDD